MIIGIGGVSRSGKSQLASQLQNAFEEKRKSVALFCQDDYVYPEETLPKIKDWPDWEHPNSINWNLLIDDIKKSARDVIIIEGLFAFWHSELLEMFDSKIFVELDEVTFLKRKKEDKRWGDEPHWYAAHIWNAFQKYVQVSEGDKNYIRVSGKAQVNIQNLLAKFN